MRSRDVLHTFLTSTLDGSQGSASHPDGFTPRESPRYPLDKRLSGPQSRSGRGGKEKITSLTLPAIVQPVA